MFVNPPEKNPNYGSIKLDNNLRISVRASELSQFFRGQVYTLEYSTNENGYHSLVKAFPQTNGGGMPQSPPPPQTAPRKVWKPSGNGNGYGAKRNGSSNDMMIFVTGVVGRTMQSGQFTMQDIMQLTTIAKDAYEAHFGRGSSQSAAGQSQPEPPPHADYDGPEEDPNAIPF
jgi:hypothetical protein